jgi:hypothetical protein
MTTKNIPRLFLVRHLAFTNIITSKAHSAISICVPLVVRLVQDQHGLQSKAVLKYYPHLGDPKLPHFIGCSVEHTIDESKQCFKRISFKECDFRPSVHLTIVLSNKKLEYEDKHDSNSNILRSELPKE